MIAKLRLAGAVALAACAAPAFFGHARLSAASYLVAYLFWVGISLGSLAMLLIHDLTGGAWGRAIRPYLESAAATLPLMTLLFVPLFFALRALYPWTDPAAMTGKALEAKAGWLNVPFFAARTAVYFASWHAVLFLRRNPRWSGPGLLLYALATTFASFDWVMSLDPRWFSTIFGVIVMGGQAISAFAFAALGLALAHRARGGAPPADAVHDVGNLLFASVLFWTYVSFSQLIIIWSANLKEEVPWYLRRSSGGWQWVITAIALFHFVVPFFLLLMRAVKRDVARLGAVAASLLFMRYVDWNWIVQPQFHASPSAAPWWSAVAAAAVGGFWLASFLDGVRRIEGRAHG